MVLYFQCNRVNPPMMIYMGKDKFENEDLIKHGWEEDVWFHVDKLSSAHVYVRMNEGQTWENLPEELLEDCSQLVKANSIEGNKKDNITIIYTPWSNLQKTGDMATGQVSFHNQRKVKRFHIETRVNAIVNRLNKTKVEKHPDLYQERMDHLKELKKKANKELQKKKLEEKKLIQQRREAKEARSYDRVFDEALGPNDNGKSKPSDKKGKSRVADIFGGESDDDGEGIENSHANDFDDFF